MMQKDNRNLGKAEKLGCLDAPVTGKDVSELVGQ
jgi:hypothetical protein